MINPRRQHDQIPLLEPHPHPPIVPPAPHVEIPSALEYIADLLVLVQVLLEELLDLGLVHGTHFVRRDGDLVAVFVGPLVREGVDGVEGGVVLGEDTEGGEEGGGDGGLGVVGETRVALWR